MASALVQRLWDLVAPLPPPVLDVGAAQCSYELLRAFAAYAKWRRLRFTLGAGTLLGAMRNQPPGLLQWEHDADVYMVARDAFTLLDRLEHDCPERSSHRRWRSRWCATLQLRGLVDRDDRPCCGFGFKLFHRRSGACELDVLVLGASDAPYMHGETLLWPPWGILLASAWQMVAGAWRRATEGQNASYYVIPEDVWQKTLVRDRTRWCEPPRGRERAGLTWCGGPPLSFFHAEYFTPGELFPVRTVRFHGLRLPIPRQPWALLNRTYGRDCAYIARLNEHRDAVADLRRREHAHLRLPARVRRRPWWQA